MPGRWHVSEDVIASIAAAAVTDVDGVCGLSANMAELLSKKSQTKGVRLTVGENDSITIDCNVIALYGHPVMELAKEITERGLGCHCRDDGPAGDGQSMSMSAALP